MTGVGAAALRGLVWLSLLVGSRAGAEPWVLWQCAGTVRVGSEQIDCPSLQPRKLSPSVSVVVETGNAVLSDTKGGRRALGSGEALTTHPSESTAPAAATLGAFVDALVGGATKKSALKADGPTTDPLLATAWVEFDGVSGLRPDRWQGRLRWPSVSHRPVIVRAFGDEDRLLLPPEALDDEGFDLTRIPTTTATLRIELLALDEALPPSAPVFRRSVSALADLPSGQVIAVLTTRLRRGAAPPLRPQATPFARLQEALASGRLPEARAVAERIWPAGAPMVIDRALSGVDQAPGFGQADGAVPHCDPSTSAESAWRCFWQRVGPHALPEWAPADMAPLWAAADAFVQRAGSGWKSRIVRAQMALLVGDYATARAALESAIQQCGDDLACDAVCFSLFQFVLMASTADFDRATMQDALLGAEPIYAGRLGVLDETVLKGREHVPPEMRTAADAWIDGAHTRMLHGVLRGLWPAIRVEARRTVADAVANKLKFVGATDHHADFLRWSFDPSRPPPTAWPQALAVGAWLLHLDRMIDPEGSVLGGGINGLYGHPDHRFYLPYGWRPPSATTVAPADLQAARRAVSRLVAALPPGPIRRQGTLSMLGATLRLAETRGDTKSLSALRDHLQNIADRARDEGATRHVTAALILAGQAAAAMGDTEGARRDLEQAMQQASAGQCHGCAAHLLIAWRQMARRIHLAERRLTAALSLIDAATDAAIEAGYLTAAALLFDKGDSWLGDQSRYQAVLARLPEQRARLARFESRWQARREALLAGGLSADDQLLSDSTLHVVRANLALTEAQALAHLAAPWPRVEKAMKAADQAQKKAGEPLPMDALTVTYRMLNALAIPDDSLAAHHAQAGGLDEMVAMLELLSGDASALDVIANQRAAETALFGEKRATMKGHIDADRDGRVLAARHKLLTDRVDYLRHAAAVRRPLAVEETLAALRADPLSGLLWEGWGWRGRAADGLAEIALNHTAKAGEAFASALVGLRDEAATFRHVPYWLRSGAQTVYTAASELALEAGETERALGLLDEWRWMQVRLPKYLAPPPLPDRQPLLEALGPGASVVVMGNLLRYGPAVVWVEDAERGLRARTFRLVEGERRLLSSLSTHFSESGQPVPMLQSMGAWLAEQIPPGRPVVLVASSPLRWSGFHRLELGGMPLARRNPTAWVPSLRDWHRLVKRAVPAGPRVAVGRPLDAEATAIGALEPRGGDAELNALNAETVLWGPAARLEPVRGALLTGRRVHLSTHGRIDTLEADASGLILADGILSLTALGADTVGGGLVVLSACNSGACVAAHGG